MPFRLIELTLPFDRKVAEPPPFSDTVRWPAICVLALPRFGPKLPPRLPAAFPVRLAPGFPPRAGPPFPGRVLLAPGRLPPLFSAGRPALFPPLGLVSWFPPD